MSLLTSLQDKAAALAALEPAVRQDADDAVHQMRVAARTLRANLRTFQDALPDPEKRTALVEELGWLGGTLSPAREAEVLTAQVLGLLNRTPQEHVLGSVRERIEAVFGLERESALELVAETLDSPRYRRLLPDLRIYLASLNTDPYPSAATADAPDATNTPGLSHLNRLVRRRLRAALPMPHGPERDAALHDARKAVRRARYAAEALGLPGAKPLKALQDVLGDEHDRVVVATALTDLAAGAQQAGENAFTYGVLLGLVRGDSRGFDRRLRRAWKAARPSLPAH